MCQILRVAFLALLALPNALAKPHPKEYVANYDDLPWDELTPNPLPSGYKSLTYNIFQVDQYDGFISPSSGTQYAMAFGGSGNISVSDPSTSFTLKSFNYACSSGVPQPECAISMWGFKGKKLAVKQVIVFPRLDPGHYIEEFVMNGTVLGNKWKGLTSVGFSIARKDNGGDMYGGLMIDDLRYTISK
ncbi:hypothetical protein QBC38DRAFT_403000 [Podospora fimiseda]|uniref:Uncharacterized protein n=1 Tax=Podospora fimiseda TaxID=252190 RepID=A0AAN7BDD2_9PEZI|nr:hypothetical protein QBC38DRAFT_403000 [Podospora fimiseda]